MDMRRVLRLKKHMGNIFYEMILLRKKLLCQLILIDTSSVFEIGCGDGALTRMIFQSKLARLWVFEIDPEWAAFVQKRLPDPRMHVFVEDILTTRFFTF